ncbi:hypothetical protein XF_2720 [Xylella fastidiosa 9a5c]|uniref:Uncharacterized protein n=1 Tax=Xylella fastidiosa (strain 9a5c) TaxID=160492 RepID=Q9PA00_XYLFA|nr:hypothetical protein XF_2720 [Xylella fastidiosa 9a5c]
MGLRTLSNPVRSDASKVKTLTHSRWLLTKTAPAITPRAVAGTPSQSLRRTHVASALKCPLLEYRASSSSHPAALQSAEMLT